MNDDLGTRLIRLGKLLQENPHLVPGRTPGERTGIAALERGVILWESGDEAVKRANRYSGRGYPKGGAAEGHGKGGHSDTTAGAALTPDPWAVVAADLKSGMRQMNLAGEGLERDIANTLHTPTGRGLREPRSDECAEPTCAATAGSKEGRCDPCYSWRYRWKQAHPGELCPPVPAKLIAERHIDAKYKGRVNQHTEGSAA